MRNVEIVLSADEAVRSWMKFQNDNHILMFFSMVNDSQRWGWAKLVAVSVRRVIRVNPQSFTICNCVICFADVSHEGNVNLE